MKISHFFLLTLFSLSLTIGACKSNKDEATTEPQTEGQATDAQSAGDQVSPGSGAVIDPSMSARGGTTPAGNEKHYKCSKAGCTGGGDAQGKCPVCGTDLVHNQAYHAQTAGTPGSSPDNAVQVNPTGGTQATPAPPTAQNAKGEYHYTCAKGHPGSGTAGNCSKCGEPLTHNQAYHNK